MANSSCGCNRLIMDPSSSLRSLSMLSLTSKGEESLSETETSLFDSNPPLTSFVNVIVVPLLLYRHISSRILSLEWTCLLKIDLSIFCSLCSLCFCRTLNRSHSSSKSFAVNKILFNSTIIAFCSLFSVCCFSSAICFNIIVNFDLTMSISHAVISLTLFIQRWKLYFALLSALWKSTRFLSKSAFLSLW